MDSILGSSRPRRNKRNDQAVMNTERETIVPGAQPSHILAGDTAERDPVRNTLFAENDSGSLLRASNVERHDAGRPRPVTTADSENLTIPVVKEEAEVHLVPVSRRVRIRKVVSERQQVVDPPLTSNIVDVDRVPINRVIEAAAEVRQEGDVTVYPVMEEVAIVTKQLVLREEIRVRRRSSEVHRPQTIALRDEEVIIERADQNSASPETSNRSPEFSDQRRINKMTKTVVGLFNSMEDAQNVKNDLSREGYSADTMRVVAKNSKDGGNWTSERESHHDEGFGASIANFFRSLTGADKDEERYYTEGIQRGGALLMVTVPDDQASAAQAILERHGARDVDETGESARTRGSNARNDAGEGRSIPVVEEELQVGKRQVQRGGVRVYSHMTQTPVEENVRLREERVTVERRPVDRPATEADLSAFKDGSIEMTETAEEAVVSKKARIVEEVVVGKEVSERTETVRDTVRKTEVEVEKLATNRAAASGRSEWDDDFRQHFNTNYARAGASWDRYAPAYEYGARLAGDPRYSDGDWDRLESSIRGDWSNRGQGSWEEFKAAIRHGWERTKSAATLSRR